ncbi:multicopper oxidase domain-containing protein, partial [Mycobacterium tuberculosis]|nr:multicopper oxidase domain-containing protein [Mycobacterium tuberculosis]
MPTIASSALGQSSRSGSQGATINSDKPDHKVPVLTGKEFDLYVSKQSVIVNGKKSMATLINDSLPAPTLKMREGDTVVIRVHNQMDESTSIHWHGILLPFE